MELSYKPINKQVDQRFTNYVGCLLIAGNTAILAGIFPSLISHALIMNLLKKSILSEASKFEKSNITIAPMNTKVSTVSATLAAIENETLKLCYVEPMEYNKVFYSSPGQKLTLTDL